MNIFLGCISESIFKILIKNDEEKDKVIKKIIKYINLGGFIEISKKYKKRSRPVPIHPNQQINSSHAFSLQGYIKLKEKRDVFYFSIINPHKGQDTLEDEEFSEDNINELKSVSCENEKNKDICSKISYINNHYPNTGHMMSKDEIFLEWFDSLTFSESMFGAAELLFFVEENSPIEIQVNNKSVICIDICSTNETEIKIYYMNEYIQYELKDITNENDIKIVEFDDKFINKIYGELNKGKYNLSFKIIAQNYKDSFRCRIRYYEEDITIKKKENMELITNFSKVNQYNTTAKKLYKLISNSQFKLIKDNQEYLHDNPEDNNNITIDYNKLYWIENQDQFEHFNYKIYSNNYKEYTVITLVNLLYFVPICKIIKYKYDNKFKVKVPGNEYFIIDEKMNISQLSDGLKNIPEFKNLIKISSNSNALTHENKRNNNNFNLLEKIFIYLDNILGVIILPFTAIAYVLINVFKYTFMATDAIASKFKQTNQLNDIKVDYS